MSETSLSNWTRLHNSVMSTAKQTECIILQLNINLAEHVEKSGHMSASCNVAKTKLNCTYCDLKGSHNTNACLKKKKANKNKETSKERDKKKNESKDNPPPPREPSNTTKRTSSTS